MPALETLKWEIENKTLSSNYFVFKQEKDSDFIVNQYILSISNVLHKDVEYIDTLAIFNANVFGACGADEKFLYVYHTEEFNIDISIDKCYNLIVVTNNTNIDCYTFQKVTTEQLTDYAYSICEGVEHKRLDRLISLCKNPYRIDNELSKISMFDPKYRNAFFSLCISDNFLQDLSDSNIIDFTNALLKNDRAKLITIYKKLQESDIEPLGVVTMLYRAFGDAIRVKCSSNPTPQSTGLKSDKQIYAISKSMRQFSNNALIDIFKMLCDIDRRLKTGVLPLNMILDYVVTFILSRC